MTDLGSKMRKLITIITESALENALIDDLEKLGAHGYTVTEARGKGHRGVRAGSWGASSNVRIEVVCGETAAQAILAHVRDTYYHNYAMIMFVSDVEVLRPEKF